MHLLLFGRVAAQVFITVLRVQHRFLETTIGAEAGDERSSIAGPALQLLVPHSAVAVTSGLLREHIHRAVFTEELTDAPRRVERCARAFTTATGGDDGVDR